MVLHANAIAQNGAAAVWAGGINGNDSDPLVLAAIKLGQLIDEGALPCSGRTCEAYGECGAGMRKQFLQQSDPPRRVVLYS